MNIESHIANLLRVITERTSIAVLPKLQAFDERIELVAYQHGHPAEIAETLMQMDQDPESRYKRLPLVSLFQDVEEVHNDKIGVAYRVRPTVAIVVGTRIEAKADQRIEETFNPVLYPIYNEFIRQISNSAFFMLKGGQVVHKKTDRYYWGSKYVARNGAANQQNDILDGIEISLDLEVYDNICKKRLQ